VGIGTNGEQQAFFDGIKVSHYNKEVGVVNMSNRGERSWDECRKEANLMVRKDFCTKKFGPKS